ncbi:Ig-like domain-containing protein [Macrococcus bovicus]|uniref:Uncharacterized protein n=1 Tax=Macrococcus bovicus TaxID=69968 RepID=A0A4R6C171_9STAP|nr:Ig-like domain-containing protein [Macrococcus bovicus]TDM14937.1 hypothetical protein ERX55_03085 [Macrococcus bovicus]
MNRITKVMMILLLFITFIPMPVQAETTLCEDTVFKVSSPRTGDTKLSGTALKNEGLTIKVDEEEYPLTVKATGEYELTLDQPLNDGQKIIIEQGSNKLEITVEEKPAETEQLLEAAFNCDGLVDKPTTEEPTTEDASTETKTEEPTTEEASTETKTEELTTEDASTETTTEEPTTEDASTEAKAEEPTTEDASTEAKTEEPTTEAKTEEPTTEAKTEEPTTEQPTVEKPSTTSATTEPPVSSSVVFKQRFTRSLLPSLDSSVQRTAVATTPRYTSCPTRDQYNSSISVNSDGPFRQSVQGNVVCVKSVSEFDAEIKNGATEVIIFMADMDNVTPNRASLDVILKSETGQKVIDANGYSLSVANGGYLLVNRNSDITNLIVKDASNLYSANNEDINGMFNIDFVGINVNIVNSTFNRDNLAAGHLGASWESALHFYGTNIINSNYNYSVFYRFVHVHDNASLTLNNAQKSGFNFQTSGKTSVAAPKSGMKIGRNATVNINVKNDAGILSQNNLFELTVGAGSKLDVKADRGFVMNTSTKGEITFDEGSIVKMDTTSDTFKLTSDTSIAINSTADVDLRSSAGRLFGGNKTHTFDIQNVAVRSWLTDSSKAHDYQTPLISSGSFSIGPKVTTPISNMGTDDFAKQFPPTMKRIQFIPSVKPPVPQAVIDDTASTITGTAVPGSVVTLKNMNRTTNNVKTATADASGNFVFTVPAGFLFKGDVLEFTAANNGLTSAPVTRTVSGNTLQLQQPADITFKSSVIGNSQNQLIRRESPVDYSVKVKDTRSSGNWNVTVKATQLMTKSKEHELKDALIFKENSQETVLSGSSAVRVADKKSMTADTSTGLYEKKWTNDSGILLKVDPVAISPGTYSGTLTWTLTSGP